jgi:MoaA/NifB/PqqE/SkfB family radical SAM enzyme
VSAGRLRQAAALARDWIAPGDAIAQWTHFVTSVCNARCAHCFYPINQKKSELTLEEIGQLAGRLPPIRLLLISGGEPFLRRDLPEILRVYFERCGFFSAGIPTNGFSASEIRGAVARICAVDPALALGVSVSLDGFAPFHDRIRAVPGLYERAIETLESLLELARATPNLTVGVTTVFLRDNQDQLSDFCDFVFERFRPSHHSLALIRGDPFDPSMKGGANIDLYEGLSARIDARYPPPEARGGFRGLRTRARREVNRRRYEYVARQARGGPFEGFCLAGEREYVLTEEGDVFGCELIGTRLGNVREAGFDFSLIRAGEAAAGFVRDKRERRCRCTHECNARTMILFDRSQALPILSAMAGIERGRRS